MKNFESYYIQQLVPVTNKLLKELKKEFGCSELNAYLIADKKNCIKF